MIAVIKANSELIRLFKLVMYSITFLTSLSIIIIAYIRTYVKRFYKKRLNFFKHGLNKAVLFVCKKML